MRADSYLTEHGYVPSRERAKKIIAAGGVTVDGRPVKKPSEDIPEGEHLIVVTDSEKYVGRGGYKLEAAITAFEMDVAGLRALDVGASTGGFTDCLLQHGARHVIAVDAGEGQLAAKLRDDPRVTNIEHLNARGISLADIGGETVDLIVMDVSFISATYIIPRFFSLLTEHGEAVCLIKPQFEVGRAMLGKGGIVKDPATHRFAIERVLQAGKDFGLTPVGLIPSPILGGDGNREFLVRFQKGAEEACMVDPIRVRRITGG